MASAPAPREVVRQNPVVSQPAERRLPDEPVESEPAADDSPIGSSVAPRGDGLAPAGDPGPAAKPAPRTPVVNEQKALRKPAAEVTSPPDPPAAVPPKSSLTDNTRNNGQNDAAKKGQGGPSGSDARKKEGAGAGTDANQKSLGELPPAPPGELPPVAPTEYLDDPPPNLPGEKTAPKNRDSRKPVYGSALTVLKGRVRSSTGLEPEQGVRVTVSSRTNAFEDRTALSNEGGRFALRVPDGDWTVKVTMPSGRIYPVYKVTVSGGLVTDDQGRDIPGLVITR
jgi:hypothetical protein